MACTPLRLDPSLTSTKVTCFCCRVDRIQPWTLTAVSGSVVAKMVLMVLLGNAEGIDRTALLGLRIGAWLTAVLA